MAKPFIMPSVVTRRIQGFSLEQLAGRLTGGPEFVRVGLPDSQTTAKGDAIRAERAQRKSRRTQKGTETP